MLPHPIGAHIFYKYPSRIPVARMVGIGWIQIVHPPGVFPRQVERNNAHPGFAVVGNRRVGYLNIVGQHTAREGGEERKEQPHQPE